MRRVYGRRPHQRESQLHRSDATAMKAGRTTCLFRRLNSNNVTQRISCRGAAQVRILAAALAVLTLAVMAQAAYAGSPSFRQIRCLAQNVYFEARGESLLGQRGVAHVVMNRADDHGFPATICDVTKEGGEARRDACQFSWWCDGRSDRPTDLTAWKQSFEVALQTYFGRTVDPTQGALWYHADYVRPAWRRNYVLGPRIGRHLFYWRSRQPRNARSTDVRCSNDGHAMIVAVSKRRVTPRGSLDRRLCLAAHRNYGVCR